MLRTRFFFVALAMSLALVGAGCGSPAVTVTPVTLNYWRAADVPGSMDAVIAKYRAIHPNVEIKVKTFREEDYQQALLEAFAEDRGPDLMSVPNVWLRQWVPQIADLPATLSVPTPVIGKDGSQTAVLQKTTSPTVRDLTADYIEVVPEDVVMTIPKTKTEPAKNLILGIPFSSDTLALLVNNDLLRKAGIKVPPTTWQDFVEAAAKLTTHNADGSISQSGATIGTAKNVRHATEILTSLMVQNGTAMADDRGYPNFQNVRNNTEGKRPAEDSLSFYQAFAIEGSQQYVWNSSYADSLDAFTAGRSAMTFGYPADLQLIRERNPRLNIGVAQLPQIDVAKPRSMARYPIETVSKKSKHINEAWDFILFAARPENVTSYLDVALKPPALRSLIENSVTKPEVGIFASQSLTAITWYKGRNYSAVEESFGRLIERPITRDFTPQESLQQTATEVTQTFR